LQLSLEAERNARDESLNVLRTEMQEINQLIQNALAETPEPNPANPDPESSEKEPVGEAVKEADQPAAEPEPVKERRRAHRWI
jgi:hypothetical protein